MDHASAVLRAFPPAGGLMDNYEYDKAAREHVKRATKLLQEQLPIVSQNARQIFDLLDPSAHSISYILLLDALMGPVFEGQATISPNDLVDRALAFFLLFDERQIRYAGPSLTSVLSRSIAAAVIPDDVLVEVLASVILKIDPSGSMLTSHHPSLVAVAYRSGFIDKAFPVIDKPIVYFPGMGTKREDRLLSDMALPPPAYIGVGKDTALTALLKADQVMEYDLLCGLIYCSARRWADAFAAFERVVSYPSREGGVAKVMAEAYNKWVLVGLLLHGRAPALPPYTASAARRAYEVVGKPYASLAAHFEALDAPALKQEAEAHLQQWQDDRNVGLVREVLTAQQKWQVAHLRGVYAKISLADIRARTCSAETGQPLATDAAVEALVGGMIESGMLRGHVEKAAAAAGAPDYLEFLPAGADEELSEEGFAARMLEAAGRVRALEPVFRATSERLGTHREYVRHLIREQKREKDGAGREAAMDFDAQVEDEDIMGGVMPGH